MRSFILPLFLAFGILAGATAASAAADSTQVPVGGSVQSQWVNG